MKPTEQQIDRLYKAGERAVELIQKEKPSSISDEVWNRFQTNNKELLSLIVNFNCWEGRDISTFQAELSK